LKYETAQNFAALSAKSRLPRKFREKLISILDLLEIAHTQEPCQCFKILPSFFKNVIILKHLSEK
jgi:hypothetical protein